MECPFSLEINDKEDQDDPMEDADEHLMKQEETDKLEPVEDFQVYQPPDPKSVFDAEIIAKKKEEERLAHIKGSVIDDDEPDFEKDDPFGRSRKHAWVFINKAKREIADAFFVEPSTGRKYQVEDAPYTFGSQKWIQKLKNKSKGERESTEYSRLDVKRYLDA